LPQSEFNWSKLTPPQPHNTQQFSSDNLHAISSLTY
jgi:hypothetical protein